jgi:hypothetical protein
MVFTDALANAHSKLGYSKEWAKGISIALGLILPIWKFEKMKVSKSILVVFAAYVAVAWRAEPAGGASSPTANRRRCRWCKPESRRSYDAVWPKSNENFVSERHVSNRHFCFDDARRSKCCLILSTITTTASLFSPLSEKQIGNPHASAYR